MADEIDLANELFEKQIRGELEKLREINAKNSLGSKFCVECGDTIPVARKKLGFRLCICCAEEAERKKQLFAG